MSSVWFITGCSNELGQLLARRLHAGGERVVLAAGSVQALHDIGREDEDRVLRIGVEAGDLARMREAAAKAIARFGGIDVLVNISGVAYFAPQEEGDLDEVRRMFDANVFGVAAATQAVVPGMRERGSGVVVNISSVEGRLTTPLGGFYQASKWALEALSESLYLEESRFGIRVIVLEPTRFDTGATWRPANGAISPFTEIAASWRRNTEATLLAHRQDPEEIVETIISAVDSDVPFARLPVGHDASALIARRQESTSSEFVEWIRERMEE